MSITEAAGHSLPPSPRPFAGNRLPGSPAALTDDHQVLQRAGARIRFTRGETIFNEGDPADNAYSVVCGAVRLCKHLADGRRQIAQFLLPGDFFSFAEMPEHTFSAEAIGDVVLVCYPQRQIERLSDERPGLRRFFASLLMKRVKDVQNHLVLLGRQTAKEKVASFLVMLMQKSGVEADERLEVPMNRQDIADFLGLTIETVCRVLSAMKRRKMIDISELHEVVIRDADALCAFADGVD